MSGDNQFKQTPARALLAFAITAALIALFSAVDAMKKDDLESFEQPTALGDTAFYDTEVPAYDPGQPILRFEGREIFRRRRKMLTRYDKYMYKVGRDEGDRYFLYQYENPRWGLTTGEGIYYLKAGDGSYVEVGDKKTPKPAPAAEEKQNESDEPSGAESGAAETEAAN